MLLSGRGNTIGDLSYVCVTAMLCKLSANWNLSVRCNLSGEMWPNANLKMLLRLLCVKANVSHGVAAAA